MTTPASDSDGRLGSQASRARTGTGGGMLGLTTTPVLCAGCRQPRYLD
jgi:hypothetical protein